MKTKLTPEQMEEALKVLLKAYVGYGWGCVLKTYI